MSNVLKKRAWYGYSDGETEMFNVRDDLLKIATDILKTIDEIDHSLALEKGANLVGNEIVEELGIPMEELIDHTSVRDFLLGLGAIGAVAGLPWATKGWIRNKRHRREAERKAKVIMNRGLFDRVMNKPVY